jgi:hypothetical protein
MCCLYKVRFGIINTHQWNLCALPFECIPKTTLTRVYIPQSSPVGGHQLAHGQPAKIGDPRLRQPGIMGQWESVDRCLYVPTGLVSSTSDRIGFQIRAHRDLACLRLTIGTSF